MPSQSAPPDTQTFYTAQGAFQFVPVLAYKDVPKAPLGFCIREGYTPIACLKGANKRKKKTFARCMFSIGYADSLRETRSTYTETRNSEAVEHVYNNDPTSPRYIRYNKN